MSEISIVPINTIDPALLTRLALCLEERFLSTALVRVPLRIPKTALNSARNQLFFGSVVGKLTAVHDRVDEFVLGITEYDLYKTSQHFIFGSSSEVQRCAVVSTHRLRSEFYGEPADENMLFQRTLSGFRWRLPRGKIASSLYPAQVDSPVADVVGCCPPL